jgi:hypothetical protein
MGCHEWPIGVCIVLLVLQGQVISRAPGNFPLESSPRFFPES